MSTDTILTIIYVGSLIGFFIIYELTFYRILKISQVARETVSDIIKAHNNLDFRFKQLENNQKELQIRFDDLQIEFYTLIKCHEKLDLEVSILKARQKS